MKKLLKIQGISFYTIALFINAFTDVGHKMVIQNTIFEMYNGDKQIILTAIVNALILLPFILLFSPSGYLADRFAKNIIMKYSALLAVFITFGITISYYMGWFYVAFACTFVLSMQSAIYSPAKYGYIKELVGTKLLTAGNALVQSVTTVAILGSIIAYTVLFQTHLKPFHSESDILKMMTPLGWLLFISSLAEFFFTSKLPNKMVISAKNRFNIKKYLSGYYLKKNMITISRKKEILYSIIAIAIFWSISQVVLAIFGAYAKDTLHITNTIYVQGSMALAGVGIVIGSIIATKYSKYYVNVGMVPFSGFGLSLMVLLVVFATSFYQIVILFTLFGIFAGLFIVPLNAYIQALSPRAHLGTILAGNNFLQNIFMFSFLFITTIFAYFGINIKILFYSLFFIGCFMSIFMFRVNIVMAIWFIFEFLLKFRFSFRYEGLQNIPKEKAILFLSNHISWIDWIIVQFPIKDRIAFMMERDIYHWKIAHSFFVLGNAIPLSEKASKDAFVEARKRIANGKKVMLFPEGHISYSGKIETLHRGYELLAGKSEGCIILCYIEGMQGSIFSRSKAVIKRKNPFSRRKVTVIYSKPLPLNTKVDEVRKKLIQLEQEYEKEN